MTTEMQITLGVVAFFALLALLTFLRLLLRREPPGWLVIKIGFFVERTPREDDTSPTTYSRKEE